MKTFHSIVIAALCILSSFAVNAVADNEYLFTLQGSNTIGAKLAPQLAREFLQARGYKDVAIQAGNADNEYIVSGVKNADNAISMAQIMVAAHGSGTGFVALQNNNADIVMSSRPVKAEEEAALAGIAKMRLPWVENAIAIDGLAILVNRNNPVNELTVNQIAQIFSGEISNWKQVGGLDSPISLYARDEKSGTWDTFRELVLGSSYPLHSSAQRFESSDLLSDKVALDRNAIGFAGLSFVHNTKLLAVADEGTGSMQPNRFTVATEDYPLSRRLFLYAPGYLEKAVIRDFIEFCQSAQGQQVVDKTGFVAQNIILYPHVVDDSAPEEYRQMSTQARRLSLNFRFDEGSPRLDNKAYRDLDRLVRFLQKKENRALKLYLVGFSDAKNNPALDMVLSRFRALAVKSALMEENITVEQLYGLGSYNPVASNNHDMAKIRNGRVEVWVAGVGDAGDVAGR